MNHSVDSAVGDKGRSAIRRARRIGSGRRAARQRIRAPARPVKTELVDAPVDAAIDEVDLPAENETRWVTDSKHACPCGLREIRGPPCIARDLPQLTAHGAIDDESFSRSLVDGRRVRGRR